MLEYFGILWYVTHFILGFSIFQSIPKYTKVCHGNPPSGAVQFSLCLCRIKDKIEIDGKDGKDGEGEITAVETGEQEK